MKPKRVIVIGSSAFFHTNPDFKPHDIDKLCVMDSWRLPGTNVLNMKKNGEDVFFFRNMTKEEYIADAIKSGVAMRLGKFLVPEFAEYINLSVADLEQLRPLVSKLDDRHEYEKVIFDAYISNGSFTLTAEQLKTAYETYKERR